MYETKIEFMAQYDHIELIYDSILFMFIFTVDSYEFALLSSKRIFLLLI